RLTATPSNALNLSWDLVLTEAVTGLNTSNLSISETGVVGSSISGVVDLGSGDSWRVTADVGTGNGDLGINLDNSTGVDPLIISLPVTSELYNIDIDLPVVTVDLLGTGDATPVITGTITDNTDANLVTIVITVNGENYNAVNNLDGTWSANVTNILPNGTYDVIATATDEATNVGTDVTIDELVVNALAPVVSVDPLSTNDASPVITGQINDGLSTIAITLNGQNYTGTNVGDGTWRANIFRTLDDGIYDVAVVATSPFNIQGFDETIDELTIDTQPPVVTLNSLTTNLPRPDITGTIDDPTALVSLVINGDEYEATNNGDGTWILPGSLLLSDLTDGVLDIQVTATDAAGNPTLSGTDGVILLDTTAPTIAVDVLLTGDNTPTITGTVDDPEALISITINEIVYEAQYTSESTWELPGEVFTTPLEDGVYDVIASAIDSLDNAGIEEAVDELTVDAIAMTLEPSDITTLTFTANWEASDVTENFTLQVAEDLAFANLIPGFEGLAVASSTSEVSHESFYHNTTYYYRVRLNYEDGTASEFSEPRAVKTLQSAGLVADSTSLHTLYEALAGEDWIVSTNWTEGLVKDWFGVTVTGDRVTSVSLPDNGLKGDLTLQSINNLDVVDIMDLSGNEITSMPTLAVMDGLVSLDVRNNQLDFASLELQGGLLSLVNYVPQAVLLNEQSLLIDEGEDGELDRRIGGLNNDYQWLENGVPIEGGDDGLLGFNDAQFVDEGLYSVRVTNSLVPGLTIETQPIQVFVSSLERDIATLLELFESLGGENWVDPSGSPIIGWGDGAPITQWSFVNLDAGVTRVEQVNLAGVGLTGDMPSVITTMTSVTRLNLANNNLTYVPDLTVMRSLIDLDISNNSLQFESLQQNLGIAQYNFSGQRVLLEASTTKVPAGENYDFTVDVRGEELTFQWFYKGDLVASTTDNTYTIESIGIDNMGDYNLIVTDRLISAIDPSFSLVSETQRILAAANISGRVFDIDGAPVNDGEVSLWGIREVGTAYDSIGSYPYVGNEYLIPDVVLGDYIHWVITDLNKHLPTYYQSSFTWSVADPVILRQNISDLDIRVINIPPPLFPGPDNDNTIAGFLELDPDLFPPGTFGDGNRTLARRRVKRAGCAFNRARFVDRGEDDVVFELIYYTLTDDDGNFIAENLPDGLYRVQIEFPGIPMDPNSFVEFELGGGGTIDQNQINLAAEVKPTGIVVTKIEETGIYRDYFKDLNIFPNPADDYLEITYERLNTEGIMMQVMDLNGAIQIEQEIPKGFDQSVQLEVSHLTPGIYIMTFMDKEQGVRSITSLKFIIER
ncbi:MAG: Ig-like domain-containing protein, partial [Cyclobacteriaceae bacterium]